MILGIAALFVATAYTEPNRDDPWYWTVLIFVGIVLFGGGFATLVFWFEERDLRLHPDSRQRRIAELTSALNKSMATISMIKREIEEGNAMLAELENRAAVTQQLARLEDPQVVAVTEQLRAELKSESRRGLIRDLVLGGVFFAMGVASTLILK
ncbi:hypothetical protein ACGFIF_24925 [Kribbella sp. NPDC049174]|uniref:hypothetical protein n=1 Tax=Kribbella sp. NPDC049174 TaxID=3364112 RepID=UPI003720748A